MVVFLMGRESDWPKRLRDFVVTTDRYPKAARCCHSVSSCQSVRQDYADVTIVGLQSIRLEQESPQAELQLEYGV
jgi:hypothetical protein